MRFTTVPQLLLTLAPTVVLADVLVTSPAAGATITAVGGQGSINIAWSDSGTAPTLANLAGYSIALMAGGNTDGTFQQLAMLLPSGTMSTGSVAQGSFSAALGPPVANAYFLKFTSAVSGAAGGGQVINYSSRFSISGMTGAAFPAGVTVPANPGTAGPARQVIAAAPAAGASTAIDSGLYATPYSLQTGLTRYAPMQGVPPTKITATNTAPLFPTSAFTVATTYLPVPTIVTTMTMPQTYSVTSLVNNAAAASQPGGAAAQKRFLERWKD